MAAVIVGAVVVGWIGGDDGDREAATQTAEEYLATWTEGDITGLQPLIADPPGSFVQDHEAIVEGLRISSMAFTVTELTLDGTTATATFDATIGLTGLGEWAYEGRLDLRRIDARWLVEWSPATIHPSVQQGRRLVRTRERPARAPVLGADGLPLVTERPAITIGIEPRRMTDPAQVKAVLQDQLGVDPAVVDRELGQPGVEPDHFVPIVRRERYDQVEPVVFPVPGLLFRETTARLAPTDGFAAHVIGRTGDITAEQLAELGPTYQVGDRVGQTGLEAAYEERLAGRPSGEVQLRDASDAVVDVLHEFAGDAPEPVATTLDGAAQQAVDQTVSDVAGAGAMVVLRHDGTVAAASSWPLSEDFNRALRGSYPPGSTFKVVTALALLTAGVTPDTSLQCDATINVGGRNFRNFEGDASGSVTFAEAFTESCNTAMIQAAQGLDDGALQAAAEQMGFNTDYTLGLATDQVERAASAIGQARITASPLHLASIGAAVASGRWTPPILLAAEAPADPGIAHELDPNVADTLRQFMVDVVDHGTGTAAQVDGRTIAGKTGTAEFGTGDPPPTHALFIGFDERYAVAVVVENGGVGGQVAAPIAGEFFSLVGPPPS